MKTVHSADPSDSTWQEKVLFPALMYKLVLQVERW